MDFQEINHSKKWKYAQREREHRFLLSEKPMGLDQYRYKIIEDKYLHKTRMRLRKTIEQESIQYKLTKKVPIQQNGNDQQWISTIYLSEQEYLLFATLPGNVLRKRRYYYPLGPEAEIGIDEIVLKDRTLWIAEIEFSEEEQSNFVMPISNSIEITHNKAYFGNEIAKIFST